MKIKDILPTGSRVWVSEPMLSLDTIPGVIIGWNISSEEGELELQYQVKFEGGEEDWVCDFQISGYLYAVA